MYHSEKENIEYIKLGGDLSTVELPLGLRSNIDDTLGNVDATFKRNSIDFFYLRNNPLDYIFKQWYIIISRWSEYK